VEKGKQTKTLSLGRQLREARRCARMTAQELARKAGLSAAAVYNCERADRGGRTRTLVRLARALGLRLRVPDLAILCLQRGYTGAKLAAKAQIGFDTVRSLLSDPLGGNLRTFEKACAAVDHPLNLVV
jgi:transcriptional regulator with XRE-family HTH domain